MSLFQDDDRIAFSWEKWIFQKKIEPKGGDRQVWKFQPFRIDASNPFRAIQFIHCPYLFVICLHSFRFSHLSHLFHFSSHNDPWDQQSLDFGPFAFFLWYRSRFWQDYVWCQLQKKTGPESLRMMRHIFAELRSPVLEQNEDGRKHRTLDEEWSLSLFKSLFEPHKINLNNCFSSPKTSKASWKTFSAISSVVKLSNENKAITAKTEEGILSRESAFISMVFK